MRELTKGIIIYWRWKNTKYTTYSKSFVQDIDGDIISLNDSDIHTRYPLLVDKNEIVWK